MKAFQHTLRILFTTFPIYDISYAVGLSFVIVSIVWIIYGFFMWLPLVAPHTTFLGEERTGAGVTRCVGASIFAIGSVFLLLVQMADGSRLGCHHDFHIKRPFRRRKQSSNSDNPSELEKGHAKHHLEGPGERLEQHVSKKDHTSNEKHQKAKSWKWYPSLSELRHHYIKDIGFLASLFEFLGAVVYLIAGITVILQIKDALSNCSRTHLNGVHWIPQVVGSVGFLLSAVLFMVETQSKWWKPNFRSLGWWAGFWNTIGSWGFLLSGAFGFWDSSQGEYQSALNMWWGSWAFLFGSVVQWHESIQKFPVEVGKEEK